MQKLTSVVVMKIVNIDIRAIDDYSLVLVLQLEKKQTNKTLLVLL